jgi:3-deoxy-D-manno-octulosonic-acid transferase
MWKIAYTLLVYVSLPVLAIVALFKPKLRKNFYERLFPKPVNQGLDGGIWIHAASLGEAMIAENLVKYLRDHGFAEPFVISTNTHYTRDLLQRRHGNSIEVYSAPFDLGWSVRHFIGSRRFGALVLIETEVWPTLIWTAKDAGIPVIILNGRISDSTIGRYRRLAFFLAEVLRSVGLVLAQSDEHAHRFAAIGVDPSRIITTGNLKYYRDTVENLPDSATRKAITFGSIREKELPLLMPVIIRLKNEFPDYTVFIVPRELHLAVEIERQMPENFSKSRYSHIKSNRSEAPDIVVVDTVGDLLQIYAMSIVAFVGGSLAPYGGQNMLEPLFTGTPVVFGPYVNNFRSVAGQIVEHRAGVMAETADDVYKTMKSLLKDSGARSAMIEAGSRVLELQQGAMKKSAEMILEAGRFAKSE